MREFGILLALLALLGGMLGLVLGSQATLGACIIGFCCLLGIFARMAQASAQHREIERLLERQAQAPQPD
jgi:hypothetical protein